MVTSGIFTALVNCKKKFVVMQGGGDAGKTVAILQYLAIEAISNPNFIITVVGQDIPNLKKGALRAFQKYVANDSEIKKEIISFNRSDRVYYFKNGSIIEFLSFDNEQDARGSERDILFMNEANAFSYQMFWQLQRKTRKKIILDYNPTVKFWSHDKLVSQTDKSFKGKVAFFITDHRGNPFLTQDEHDAYENISDPDLFKIYARGETGAIKGIIYTAKECDSIPDNCTEVIWGIDYGYSSDPTAIMKVGIRGKDRFIQECHYSSLDNAELIKSILVANGWNPSQYVFSEHDKRIINELINLGVPVYLANKKNKVSNISKCKSFNLFYTKESVNTKREFEGYKWATASNINTGEEVTTNVPIDGNDHAMDGMNYAINTHAIMFNL